MNERNEIMSDWYEDLRIEEEREEANRLAPEPEPPSEEELEAMHLDWCERHEEAPDLIPDGEGLDGTPYWRFV